MDTQSTYDAAAISLFLNFFSNFSTGPMLPPIDFLMETVLKEIISLLVLILIIRYEFTFFIYLVGIERVKMLNLL